MVELTFDLDAVRGRFTRKNIEAGPTNLWRYGALLPLPEGFQSNLPVGFTPLVLGLLLASGRGQEAVSVHRTEFERRTLRQDYARLRDTAERAGMAVG